MKRFIMSIALGAFVAALLAPLALAQSSSSTPSSTPSAAPKIDINSASKEDLMSLPGVGDATADKIIAGRPWKSKSELTKKKVVGSKEYDKIKNHIIAHQETPAAK